MMLLSHETLTDSAGFSIPLCLISCIKKGAKEIHQLTTEFRRHWESIANIHDGNKTNEK